MKKKLIVVRPVSQESVGLLGEDKKRLIYSKFTVDPYNCECKGREKAMFQKAATLPEIEKKKFIEDNTPIHCKNIKGKTKYQISCPKCRELVAEVYAKNVQLDNFADLHYVSWHDKVSWHGTFGVNIDPATAAISFECCCGFKDLIKNYTVTVSK